MPGIVVLITPIGRAAAEAQLRTMVASLKHELSYEVGMWIDEGIGLYVGWVARPGSFSRHMPVCNERGDLVLIYSGEDYPDPSSIGQLRGRGHRFDVAGAAYLVHLAEEDSTFPAGLNGRFHGILIDRSQMTANVFNDRFGLHRLYYHEANDGWYLAAEAKAILAVRPELRRIDPTGLGEFIACGCVLENRSVFEGIGVLPPGSIWCIRNATVTEKNLYFTPHEWESQEPSSSETSYKDVKHAFVNCLPRYFNGHEGIGMSLTGGLDSRMIIAWHKSAPKTLPFYSFGGTYRECQDVRIARRLASAYGQTHSVISVGEEFLARFSHYAERSVYLSDGCVHVTHAPDLYVNAIAARIAPVRITGNYGGEVLRGLRAFKPVDIALNPFTAALEPQLLAAKHTYSAAVNVHPVSFAAFRQAPWHHYGLLSLEQTQLTLRAPFLDNEVLRAAYRIPATHLQGADICLRLIQDGDPSMMRIPTDRGFGGRLGGLPALCVRMYLAGTSKAEYVYDYGMPQWLAKVDHVLSRLKMERLFLGRNKFYHFRVWYRDVLHEYVRSVLLDPRSLSRWYVNRAQVEALVTAHLRGTGNHTSAIHKLLTLELLHRLFIDCR